MVVLILFLVRCVLYLIFGLSFVYFACHVPLPSVWNGQVFMDCAFAAFDFLMSYKEWARYRRRFHT